MGRFFKIIRFAMLLAGGIVVTITRAQPYHLIDQDNGIAYIQPTAQHPWLNTPQVLVRLIRYSFTRGYDVAVVQDATGREVSRNYNPERLPSLLGA